MPDSPTSISFVHLDQVIFCNKKGKQYVSLTFKISTKQQWDMYEAYRYTMAEINGIHHISGQLNLFE